MMARFEHSWRLFKASLRVTMVHRKLLWFPVLTSIATAVIALFFLSALAVPLVLHDTGYHLTQKQHWAALKNYYLPASGAHNYPIGPIANVTYDGGTGKGSESAGAQAGKRWVWADSVLIYFFSMFLATFFNVAFYNEIISALNGNGVSFRRGLMVAWSRLPAILMWSLLAGLVGWVIRRIEDRAPIVGRLVAAFIGLAWSIAAVFAIPVIIQEEELRNPFKVLQHSAMSLKRTWGEGLIGFVGFHAANLAIFLMSLIPLFCVCAAAYALKSWVMGITAGALWLLALIFYSYVVSVAGTVYRCALYLFAAEGVVPEAYDRTLLDMAWKVKKT